VLVGLLDNKVAVVTGGAQGIGFELARVFASQGAAVVIADVNLEGADHAATQISAAGTTAIPVRRDVTSELDVTELLASAVAQLGRVDIMVNNAGITKDATLRNMSLAEFRTVIDVHLQGSWLGTRAAAAVMREQAVGSIINMSSISGKVGNIGQTNYSAAKAGIVGLTKAAAKELAHVGVRVNALQPGLIRTAMTEAMRQDIWEQKLREIPLGRAGEPSDVANSALFLASDLSSYLTGAVLEVTGGRYM
jgi:3-oxoacyl-[acyl-carrier protein] reductase